MAGKQYHASSCSRRRKVPGNSTPAASGKMRLTKFHADEPRRSVRATKGQHTKKDDELPVPEPAKKRSKKNAKKAEEEEATPEAEIIRCVCGARETHEEDDEPWIACDNCQAWQHNVCMGISTFDEDVPDSYLCEMCSPPAHKELLDGITKGIKVWEDRRRAYEKSQEKPAKKGGKKAKQSKRTSDPKLELSTNGKAKSPSVPAPEKKEKKETTRAGKRKDGPSEAESASKVRKVSNSTPGPAAKSPISDLPTKISDLEHARQGPAKLLQKSLLATIPDAVSHGIYRLHPDDTIELKAERLAIQVEDAIFKAHPNTSAYGSQSRAVVANIKGNQELCNNLLIGTLTPHNLAVMETDQMASKELQRQRAEMKAKSDKQSIMITDDGPRVRRTHKGEEIVEQDTFAVPSDISTAARIRREADPNGDMATRSRENSPGDEVELPDNIDDYRSQDNIRANATPKDPLKVDTKSKPAVRKQSSVQDFDIKTIFSSVQSPTGGQHVRKPSLASNAPPVNGPGVDPEIDKMLEDDGNDSPPYSPAEYSSDPDVVWRGSLTMDTVAQFTAIAKHVGGADLSRQPFTWTDVLHRELRVAGRIAEDKANEYLCGLRWSQNTDLVVISLTPTGEAGIPAHEALFNYFREKKRYGVFSPKSPGNVRDTYLIPVPASPASLPDFMENLEGHKLTGERPDPIMLIALVIRHDWQPTEQRGVGLDGVQEAQSPSVMTHPHRQMSVSGTGPSMSPIVPQGAFQSPAPSTHSEEAQRRHAQEEQRRRDQAEGEATAARILGTFIHAPTVHFLMPQAFHMRSIEWEVIREIFQKDSKAQQDLAHLSQLLEQQGPRAQ
ncbi:hypothetical protein BP5796_03726 [Coleophoma crateriformis]|uniref:Transcription factor BYE1 n=1 Tax=Coleophoma crateriformis TaxID=565419 RepID=A0A3D8SGU6_9HELO|nr:hypothetical protein BP5796_03726 [Coleophoma crateriformis]